MSTVPPLIIPNPLDYIFFSNCHISFVDPLVIVMEYASKGCLKDYLKCDRTTQIYGNLAHGSTSLTSRDLLTFAYQVAQGMDHVSKLQVSDDIVFHKSWIYFVI